MKTIKLIFLGSLITIAALLGPRTACAYYDPVEGRFLSPDPLGHAASLSLYDFCAGDPVNGFDPDGRLSKGFAYGLGDVMDKYSTATMNIMDAVLNPIVGLFDPVAAKTSFGGGHETGPSYSTYLNGSMASQFGFYGGYAVGEVAIQGSMFIAGGGMGGIMESAALRNVGAIGVGAVTRMGGTMALRGEAAAIGAQTGQWGLAGAGATMTGSSGAGQSVVRAFNASESSVASGAGALPPRNALLSPMNGEVGGSLSAAKTPLTNQQLVQKAATKAEDAIGGTGRNAGTDKHNYATALLERYQRRYGNRGLEFKVYFNNGPGNRGFLDVLDTKNSVIYDWKFGYPTRSLQQLNSTPQMLKYRRNWSLPTQIVKP